MAQQYAADVERVPDHMKSAARAYIEDGRAPGGFLKAVLSNDLMGAFSKADSANERKMKAWTMWMFNDIPADAWGSEQAVEEWVESGGMNGR